jgi:hypothetical protein
MTDFFQLRKQYLSGSLESSWILETKCCRTCEGVKEQGQNILGAVTKSSVW